MKWKCQVTVVEPLGGKMNKNEHKEEERTALLLMFFFLESPVLFLKRSALPRWLQVTCKVKASAKFNSYPKHGTRLPCSVIPDSYSHTKTEWRPGKMLTNTSGSKQSCLFEMTVTTTLNYSSLSGCMAALFVEGTFDRLWWPSWIDQTERLNCCTNLQFL